MNRKEQYYRMGRLPQAAMNPVAASLKRAYDKTPGHPIRSGILPNRNRVPTANKPLVEDYVPNELSSRSEELMCRFFLNSGLSHDTIESPTFANLIRLLNPQTQLPSAAIMEACVEKLAFPSKPFINYQKAIGPLTATLDIHRHNDEIFLAYSIHYFDEYVTRKNAIYLRKLILCEVDGESIMTCVRRAINNFNYGNVRFTNLVTANEEYAREMYKTDSVKHSYICFFTYLTRFVEEVLSIEDFSRGLASLRGFVLFLRRHADLYSKFRRLQLSKNGDLDLPCLDTGKWTSTTTFLSKCLALHETFADFATRWRLTTYITDEVYTKLSYLQRLLSYVQRFAKEMSTTDSTMSQVVPTVISIKCFLENKSLGFPFEKHIKKIFAKHLKPLISGYEDMRYDFACLLDPRYGYRETIYSLDHWSRIELELKKIFSQEDMVINEKCPSETIILKPYAKEIRMNKIEEELEVYRSNLANTRPNMSISPFSWWGTRMQELHNLYNKSRELLAPPAVTIDAEHYFGRCGKFTHMASKLTYQQLENALIVAAQQEVFKGRGYTSETLTIPAAIANFDPIKHKTVQELTIRRPAQRINCSPVVQTRPYQNPNNVNEPEPVARRVNAEEIERMMMEPPPDKRCRMDNEVKEEVLDEEEDVKPDVTKIAVNPPKTAAAPDVPEVKDEPIDDGYEQEKKPENMTLHLPNITTAKDTNSLSKQPSVVVQQKSILRRPVVLLGKRGTIAAVASQITKPKVPSNADSGQGTSSSASNSQLPVEPKAEPVEETVAEGQLAEPKSEDPPKKKACNRRCNICLQIEEHDALKHITIPNEKLVVLLGMVIDGKMSVDEARYCYSRGQKSYICRRHFIESRDQLYTALNVSSTYEVFNAKLDRVKNILEVLTDILGSTMSVLDFKQMFIVFAEKYSGESVKRNAPRYQNLVLNQEEERESNYAAAPAITDPTYPTEGVELDFILPKALRAPRKQILQVDEEDSIVRHIIRSKPWEHKQNPEEADPKNYKNPSKCAYCTHVHERGTMLKVPKSEERRHKWVNELGPEFAERLKTIELPYICRTHFPESAFSSRGRLLKGMLPANEDKVVSYKFKGNRLEQVRDEPEPEVEDEEEEDMNMSSNDQILAAVAKQL